MKEFQKIPGSSISIHVERTIIAQLQEDRTKTGVELEGGINITSWEKPIVLRIGRPYLPFLKRVALVIAPPYNPTDVHVVDKRCTELGNRLRNELGQFWEFGEKYTYLGEEKEDEHYRKGILDGFARKRLASIGAGESVLGIFDEDRLKYAQEKLTSDEKDFREARN